MYIIYNIGIYSQCKDNKVYYNYYYLYYYY